MHSHKKKNSGLKDGVKFEVLCNAVIFLRDKKCHQSWDFCVTWPRGNQTEMLEDGSCNCEDADVNWAQEGTESGTRGKARVVLEEGRVCV